ncbi:MAG: helix-turn-helix transcriptional regulator [Dehalococcoidia bacterium]|nr:MAG: helix-turn-helix transcriptional regulator [Dehalococcoidia bacterium]
MKEERVKKSGASDKSKSTHRRYTGSDDFLTAPSQPERTIVGPPEKEQVGDRIKKAREIHSLTLEDLSSRTGIDVDTLRHVESNKLIPPLGELIRLGKALETRMSYFISPGVDKPLTVVKADQRRPIARYGRGRRERYGYSYESLAPEKANRLMEPFIVTLTPTEVAEPSTHDGQEFLFVLEGEMEARVGNQTEILGPGDAVYYDSSQPHLVRCVGDREARILAVLYAGRA